MSRSLLSSRLGSLVAPWALSAALLGGAACQNMAAAPATSRITGALAGQEGALVVTAPDTIVNRYASLAADANEGDESITLSRIADLMPLAEGDLLLVVQMQGATIDTSDATSYGTVQSLNGAGRYEFAHVESIEGDTVRLVTAVGRLRNSYQASGRVQVVRVPQVASLSIMAGGTLTAPAWDGRVGGIVAVHVLGSAEVHGAIDVSGRGFRGGSVDPMSRLPATDVTLFASGDQSDGGEKGEGIAGSPGDYDAMGGRYGRGAPANGGGGANAFKSGGGGGANAGSIESWTGQGRMDANPAWMFDPGVQETGHMADSSGGGRGGYTMSELGADPLAAVPGDALWGGAMRRERGGLGGHPVSTATSERIFFGGGGGAGDSPDGTAGPGGSGGGIVYLVAADVSGAGVIAANGTAGADTSGLHLDGTGGGGAGGTVVLHTGYVSGLNLRALGGHGGSQLGTLVGSQGPGGGGGGGVISSVLGDLTGQVSGGESGGNMSPTFALFPANGATVGAAGEGSGIHNLIANNPLHMPSDLEVVLRDRTLSSTPGGSALLGFAIINHGPNAVVAAELSDRFAEGSARGSWRCSSQGSAVCATESGSGALRTRVDIPAGEEIRVDIELAVSSRAAGVFAYALTAQPGVSVVDPFQPNNIAILQDALAPQADLSTKLMLPVARAQAGARSMLTLQVANAGPSLAQRIRAELTVPAGLRLAEARGEGWQCAQQDAVLSCTREELDRNQASDIEVSFDASEQPGSMEFRASVQSAETGDPRPDNNADKVQLSVDAPTSGTSAPIAMGDAGGCSVAGRASAAPQTAWVVLMAAIARMLRRRPRSA